MERRVAARAVIVKDGKLFCIKLKDYKSDGAKALGTWITVGGKLDPLEPLIDGVKREVLEETGVEARVGNVLYVQQFAHHGVEQLEFFFHVTNANDFGSIDLSKTTHGEEEIAEFAFIDPKEAEILPRFLNDESFENLENQPTKIFNYL
jgi:8-oxo-dGTP diphosphatase